VFDYFNDTAGHYSGDRRTPTHFIGKGAILFGFSLYLIYDFQELHGFTHQICGIPLPGKLPEFGKYLIFQKKIFGFSCPGTNTAFGRTPDFSSRSIYPKGFTI